MEVVWSRVARDQIKDIRAYLNARNPAAAATVVRAIREAGDRLAMTPLMGHAGEDGTREWLVTRYPSYLLIYDILPSPVDGRDMIVVLAVLHQARLR